MSSTARRLSAGSPALLLLLLLTLPAAGALPPVFRSAVGKFTLVRPRDPAPDTPLAALDGSTVDLHRYRGKVVVLNVWATWCAPCAAEMPSLDRLRAMANPAELAVAAISIDAQSSIVRGYLAEHRLTGLTVLLDPDQKLVSQAPARIEAGALRLRGLPVTYIIDKEGRVAGYIVGAAMWDSPEARDLLDYFIHKEEGAR